MAFCGGVPGSGNDGSPCVSARAGTQENESLGNVRQHSETKVTCQLSCEETPGAVQLSIFANPLAAANMLVRSQSVRHKPEESPDQSGAVDRLQGTFSLHREPVGSPRPVKKGFSQEADGFSRLFLEQDLSLASERVTPDHYTRCVYAAGATPLPRRHSVQTKEEADRHFDDQAAARPSVFGPALSNDPPRSLQPPVSRLRDPRLSPFSASTCPDDVSPTPVWGECVQQVPRVSSATQAALEFALTARQGRPSPINVPRERKKEHFATRKAPLFVSALSAVRGASEAGSPKPFVAGSAPASTCVSSPFGRPCEAGSPSYYEPTGSLDSDPERNESFPAGTSRGPSFSCQPFPPSSLYSSSARAVQSPPSSSASNDFVRRPSRHRAEQGCFSGIFSTSPRGDPEAKDLQSLKPPHPLPSEKLTKSPSFTCCSSQSISREMDQGRFSVASSGSPDDLSRTAPYGTPSSVPAEPSRKMIAQLDSISDEPGAPALENPCSPYSFGHEPRGVFPGCVYIPVSAADLPPKSLNVTRRVLEATLRNRDLRQVASAPPLVDENEWIATQLASCLADLQLLLTCIWDACSCPVMAAGSIFFLSVTAGKADLPLPQFGSHTRRSTYTTLRFPFMPQENQMARDALQTYVSQDEGQRYWKGIDTRHAGSLRMRRDSQRKSINQLGSAHVTNSAAADSMQYGCRKPGVPPSRALCSADCPNRTGSCALAGSTGPSSAWGVRAQSAREYMETALAWCVQQVHHGRLLREPPKASAGDPRWGGEDTGRDPALWQSFRDRKPDSLSSCVSAGRFETQAPLEPDISSRERQVHSPSKCVASSAGSHARVAEPQTRMDEEGGTEESSFVLRQQEERFRELGSRMCRRLFRCYAHIYHYHLDLLSAYRVLAHVNRCFKVFLFFAHRYSFLAQSDVQPLRNLVAYLLSQFENLERRPSFSSAAEVLSFASASPSSPSSSSSAPWFPSTATSTPAGRSSSNASCSVTSSSPASSSPASHTTPATCSGSSISSSAPAFPWVIDSVKQRSDPKANTSLSSAAWAEAETQACKLSRVGRDSLSLRTPACLSPTSSKGGLRRSRSLHFAQEKRTSPDSSPAAFPPASLMDLEKPPHHPFCNGGMQRTFGAEHSADQVASAAAAPQQVSLTVPPEKRESSKSVCDAVEGCGVLGKTSVSAAADVPSLAASEPVSFYQSATGTSAEAGKWQRERARENPVSLAAEADNVSTRLCREVADVVASGLGCPQTVRRESEGPAEGPGTGTASDRQQPKNLRVQPERVADEEAWSDGKRIDTGFEETSCRATSEREGLVVRPPCEEAAARAPSDGRCCEDTITLIGSMQGNENDEDAVKALHLDLAEADDKKRIIEAYTMRNEGPDVTDEEPREYRGELQGIRRIQSYEEITEVLTEGEEQSEGEEGENVDERKKEKDGGAEINSKKNASAGHEDSHTTSTTGHGEPYRVYDVDKSSLSLEGTGSANGSHFHPSRLIVTSAGEEGSAVHAGRRRALLPRLKDAMDFLRTREIEEFQEKLLQARTRSTSRTPLDQRRRRATKVLLESMLVHQQPYV